MQTPEQRAQEQARTDSVAALDRAAAVAIYAGEYAAAEADARAALSSGPDSGEGQELLASALYAQGKDQEALQAYQVMANQGWNPPRVWLPYALLLLKSGDWTDALAAYEKALPLVSEQNSPVCPHLDQAFAFSPDDPQPAQLAAALHAALALTYDWECDWAGNSQADRAQAEYRQALQIAPDWDMANYYYGDFLQRHGQRAEAQAAFTRTLKVAHGGVKLAARRALAKLRQPA